MNLRYDPDADALYLQFGTDKIVETKELHPGLIVDFDAQNRIVGIEMIHLSHQLSPAALDEIRARYKDHHG